jgi:hypothetical protein
MVRSKSSVKYYAKQIKHIIMRKDVVYLGMIWCNDIMSLNTSDEGYNDGKKCGKKGAICGPNSNGTINVGDGSHSWIATGVEPNAHLFYVTIDLMGDQMGRDPGRNHSNSGTNSGM